MHEDQKHGIIYTAAAYILWGVLPLYWKLIKDVSAYEILAHRIVWSFLFMTMIVFLMRKWRPFLRECKRIWKAKRDLAGITLASITISINWVTFIWAVNSDHVVEASLGYYINPLVSILLGMIFLKETFSRAQWLAFALAAAGVSFMTVNFGAVPWVALLLAFSFGFYGLLKKVVQLGPMFGLTIETLIVSPVALLYLMTQQNGNWGQIDVWSSTALLLFGAGIVTAVPLLLFAGGAKRIPLSMVGFLQYIAPTLMLLIGVILYHEPFTVTHMISFSLIWAGLTVYTVTRVKRMRSYEAKAS
ncbi:EamA family transporter RarD [Thalassobacillus sp. CUG 92003]|uniref:EamA family transporter RarD n=1 Tax=Thalassobacillus sp. CUG 92003 TaxID=2736641 RepID=UPI0015E7C97A|nr:EamA family transporter RarD [Thalassobacillus sp. CUG 92003]